MFAFVSNGFCRQAPALAATLFLACVAIASAKAGDKVWTTHGPFGGIVDTPLVVDPKTPSTIYQASPVGGVFKSLDRGAHWAPASNGLTDPTCYTLAIDPTNHEILYTAGGNGIFKSTDGAAHWAQVAFIVNVLQIVIDPATPTTLYAVLSENALQKSVDGGKTWVSQYNSLPSEEINVFAIDPKTPSNLYAGAFGGLYKSTNSGKNWNLVTEGLGTGFIDVVNLWIDPQTPSVLYANTGLGVEKSIDSGNKWTVVDTGFYAGNFNLLAIDPLQGATLYGTAFSTNGVYISRNSGGKWTELGALPADFFGNVATLTVDPTKSANLYTGTNQGMFVSANQGKTWTEGNQGLSNTLVTALALDPKAPDTLYAATEGSGIFKTTNGGQSWKRQYSAINKVASLLIDPTTPTTLYFGDEFGSGVFKSTDAGAKWTNILTPLTVLSMAMDQQNPNILFVGGGSASLYESIDAGKSWKAENTGLPSGFSPTSISASGGIVLTVDPNNGGIYYAAYTPPTADEYPTAPPATTMMKFRQCLNSNNSIRTALNKELGDRGTILTADDSPLALALDRVGDTLKGPIAKCRSSTNAAEAGDAAATFSVTSWAAPTGVNVANCPPMTALVGDPLIPTTFYTGGVCGVLKGTNDGAKLAAVNAGLPVNVPIFALAITPTANILYAGTYGGGVYSFTNP